MVGKGDREQNAEKQRANEPGDYTHRKHVSRLAPVEGYSPLDTADEEPSQRRKKKCAPPVGNGRHIRTMQDVMADYAAMEMLPREMCQFGKHHQSGEEQAQLRTSLFAHNDLSA